MSEKPEAVSLYQFFQRFPDEEAARQIAAIPAKRFGGAEEFGEICAFVCSNHAGYITGQNLLVDGGLYTSAF